jgi:hypothetical protein
MKTAGKRRESQLPLLATGELLAEGARFGESVAALVKSAFVPKGVYRYKSHEDANHHQQDCLIQGMGRLAAQRK